MARAQLAAIALARTERSGRRSRPIRLGALSAAHLLTFTVSLSHSLAPKS